MFFLMVVLQAQLPSLSVGQGHVHFHTALRRGKLRRLLMGSGTLGSPEHCECSGTREASSSATCPSSVLNISREYFKENI